MGERISCLLDRAGAAVIVVVAFVVLHVSPEPRFQASPSVLARSSVPKVSHARNGYLQGVWMKVSSVLIFAMVEQSLPLF